MRVGAARRTLGPTPEAPKLGEKPENFPIPERASDFLACVLMMRDRLRRAQVSGYERSFFSLAVGLKIWPKSDPNYYH